MGNKVNTNESLLVKLARTLSGMTDERKARILAKARADRDGLNKARAEHPNMRPEQLAQFRALFGGEMGRIMDEHDGK